MISAATFVNHPVLAFAALNDEQGKLHLMPKIGTRPCFTYVRIPVEYLLERRFRASKR